MQRVPRRKGESGEGKRGVVAEELTRRIEYAVCPCCGKNKMISFNTNGLDWVDYDLQTMEFIQVREGGGKTGTGKKGRGQGRGIGFPKVDSMTLAEAVAKGGKHLEVAQDIANRVLAVHREFQRVGLIP